MGGTDNGLMGTRAGDSKEGLLKLAAVDLWNQLRIDLMRG